MFKLFHFITKIYFEYFINMDQFVDQLIQKN